MSGGSDYVAFTGYTMLVYTSANDGFQAAVPVLNCSYNTVRAGPLFVGPHMVVMLVDDQVRPLP